MLSVFTVELQEGLLHFKDGLTSVLEVALRLGTTEEFDGEDLPIQEVPGWFVEISSNPENAPLAARRGRDQYLANIVSGPWPLQDWLYRFCPDEDSRGWSWWDMTPTSDGDVHLWVDSWGEDFFGCDDLRWLAYTAGARRVVGPEIRQLESWLEESSTQKDDNEH
ncbi:hypothetical protein [Streptomyces abyssalis]|uniref:hypothetical protein n=1 Tax=Streptomyces abyssalis TaxID=933944 RepID=UPI001FE0F7E3|nr:hypothetical protein [Streptomyces abyssalis]